MVSTKKAICAALFATTLAVSAASAGPIYVSGVADWNQPLLGGGAPGGVNGPWGAWCVPAATANIIGFYQDTMGVVGIGDGLAFPNTNAWPASNFQDDSADGSGGPRHDLGWYYNTNDNGMGGIGWNTPGWTPGTRLANVAAGITGYFTNDGYPSVNVRNYGGPSAPVHMAPGVYAAFDNTGDIQNTHNTAGGFQEIRQEIDAGRPMLGHWNHGVFVNRTSVNDAPGLTPDLFAGSDSFDIALWGTDPTNGGMNVFDDTDTGERWDVENGLGHTMTIVGYWLSSDLSNPFFNQGLDGVVVLDNRDGFLVGGQPLPLVLPWTNSPWSGVTSISQIPTPSSIALLALAGLSALCKNAKR